MPATLLLDGGHALTLTADVAVTLQDVNVLQPASSAASFSTEFSVAATLEAGKALALAHVGTSPADTPYRELPCALEQDGVELLPRGRAVLTQHDSAAGFSGRVYGGNKELFAALDSLPAQQQKLSALDFTRFDHPYLLDAVAAGTARVGWQQGYCYEVYDRGKGAPVEEASIDIYEDRVYPSVYARAVWEQIFVGLGLRWAGALPAQFDKLLMPAVQASGYGESFILATHLLADIGRGNTDKAGRSAGRSDVVKTVPFDSAPLRAGYYEPTQAGIWDPTAHTWKAPVTGYVNVKASIPIAFDIDYGKVGAELFVYKNGQQGAAGEQVVADTSNPTVSASIQTDKLLVQKDDVLSIVVRLHGKGGSLLPGGDRWGYTMFDYATYQLEGSYLKATQWQVEYAADFPPGGLVRLGDWLPDMSQKDFVKAVIGLYGLALRTDPYSGVVTFTPAASVLTRQADAPAWDARRDAAQPTVRQWHLDGVARRNWFRWKEDGANPDSAKGLGNGVLLCGDGTAPAEATLLELPFAATAGSTTGSMLLLPLFKRKPGVTDSGQAEYEEQTPAPRLVVQTERTLAVDLVVHTDELVNGQWQHVVLPANRRRVTSRLSMFAGVGVEDLSFTNTLLPRYYPHLAAVLRRPLLLSTYVRLSAVEAQGLEQLVPVWLEREGHWFLLHKAQVSGGVSAQVELLRLNP